VASNTQSMAKSNVIPLREPLPDDLKLVSDEEPEQKDTPDPALAEQPKPSELTTAQKVGVGVGVAGVTGLAGFGLYKLGVRMGWWGGASPIIIDDPQDGGSKDGARPIDDARPIDGGGGSTRARAIGKPPNVSGDQAGYNTQRYPSPGPVRLTMTVLGYKVEYNNKTLVPDGQGNAEVNRFQVEWNKVIHGLDSGSVKFPTPVDDSSKLAAFRGLLDADGIPGKNTLNAMEIAFNNQLKNKMSWTSLVKQA
jgi:hypothetical protein